MSDDLRLSHLTEPQRRALMHERIREAEARVAAYEELVQVLVRERDEARALVRATVLGGDAA